MEFIIVYCLLAAVLILLMGILFKIIKKPDENEDLSRMMDEFSRKFDILESKINDFKSSTADEFQRNRNEISKSLKEMNELILKIQSLNTEQSEKLTATLTENVAKLQESNEKKLDQMRQTVDEKLTSTLSKRLDSSFEVIGKQLENVYKSLGEMKELAGGVSDLQRVLTNVKARGTWAEVQLGSILEQTLTPDQYACNVKLNENNNTLVEFAIKIPSKEDDNKTVWLPLDSKFPQEDYIRISEAAAAADKIAVDAAVKQLENTIKTQAKKISSLYINVPKTTDFAIMFLATEGLYAEVLRIPGLCEELQNKYRIMVCGPTTVTAFLNTLRMGFRTIAIDKRAADVWNVLGAVKSQYDTFEDLLEKARKKIEEAGNTIDNASKRNSIIQKKLKSVESLESGDAENLLGIEE